MKKDRKIVVMWLFLVDVFPANGRKYKVTTSYQGVLRGRTRLIKSVSFMGDEIAKYSICDPPRGGYGIRYLKRFSSWYILNREISRQIIRLGRAFRCKGCLVKKKKDCLHALKYLSRDYVCVTAGCRTVR